MRDGRPPKQRLDVLTQIGRQLGQVHELEPALHSVLGLLAERLHLTGGWVTLADGAPAAAVGSREVEGGHHASVSLALAGGKSGALHVVRRRRFGLRELSLLQQVGDLVGATLGRARQPVSILEVIASAARGALLAYSAGVFLAERPGRLRLAAVSGWGAEALQALAGRSAPETPPAAAVSTGEPVVVADAGAETGYYIPPGFLAHGLRGLIVAPLGVDGRTLGALALTSRAPGVFTPEHVPLLRSLAGLAAAALERSNLAEALEANLGELRRLHEENARLLEREQKRARQLRLINEIGRRMAVQLEAETALQTVTDGLVERFGYANASIFAIDWAMGELVLQTITGPLAGSFKPGQYRRSLQASSVTAWAVAHGETAVVNDTESDPRYAPLPEPFGALVVAPIRQRGELVGALAVHAREKGAFDSEDVAVVETLADQAAVSLEAARLYQAAVQHAKELRLLLETSTAAAFAATLEEALASTLQKIVEGLPVTLGRVALLSEDGQDLEVRAGCALRGFAWQPGIGHRYPLARAPAQRQAIERGESLAVHLAMDEELAVSLLPHVATLLVVPLRAGDSTLGVLLLGEERSASRRTFTQGELALCQSLANQVAMAVQRAQAFWRLSDSYQATLEALAVAIDSRDHETHGHSLRVAAMAVALGRAMGLSDADLTRLARGALLHDIGKLAIPDAILNKPGPLTDVEREHMKQHPVLGARILKGIPFLEDPLAVVLHHHERWDGGGYPAGLQGEAIPLAARLFAVVDTYDAITSDRPYRQAKSAAEAVAEIRRGMGSQFDPLVAETFLTLVADGRVDAAVAAGIPWGVARGEAEPSAAAAGHGIPVHRVLPPLAQVARRLLAPIDLDGVLNEVLSQTFAVFGYAVSAILLVDYDTQTLYPRALRGHTSGMEVRIPLAARSIVSRAAGTGEPYYAPDVLADPWYREGTPGIRSELALPLIVENKVIGVLDVESPKVDDFPPDVRTVLEAFATFAALAIHRAQLDGELRRLSLSDGLTGLANHRGMVEALEREVARARRKGEPLSIVLLELDRFKSINDRFGHLAGDEALRRVARKLRENCRAMDLAARFGGDEFLVLLPGSDLTGGLCAAQRIRKSVGEIEAAPGVRLSASLGVAAFPADGETPEALIEAADRAMYGVKRAGGDGVAVTQEQGRQGS